MCSVSTLVRMPHGCVAGCQRRVDPGTRSPEFVQTLERGLAVIRAFDEDRRSLTLSDVGRTMSSRRA
jgi:hypothetical protein